MVQVGPRPGEGGRRPSPEHGMDRHALRGCRKGLGAGMACLAPADSCITG